MSLFSHTRATTHRSSHQNHSSAPRPSLSRRNAPKRVISASHRISSPKTTRITDFFAPKYVHDRMMQFMPSPAQELMATQVLRSFPPFHDGEIGDFTLRRFENGCHMPYMLHSREDIHFYYMKRLFQSSLFMEFLTPRCFPLAQNRGTEIEKMRDDVIAMERQANARLGLFHGDEAMTGMDLQDRRGNGSSRIAMMVHSEKCLYFNDVRPRENQEDDLMQDVDPQQESTAHITTRFEDISLPSRCSEARWRNKQPQVLISYYNSPNLDLMHCERNFSRNVAGSVKEDILDFQFLDDNNVICGTRRGGIQAVDLRQPPKSAPTPTPSLGVKRPGAAQPIGRARKRRRCGYACASSSSTSGGSSSPLKPKGPLRSINRCDILDERNLFGGSDDGFIEIWDRRKLSTAVNAFNMHTMVQQFEKRFEGNIHSDIISLPGSADTHFTSHTLAASHYATQPLSGSVSYSITGLTVNRERPHHVAFQLQSGQCGLFNFVDQRLTKLFHKYDHKCTVQAQRKTPLIYAPLEMVQMEEANFLFCPSQKHLFALDFSEPQYNNIDTTVLQSGVTPTNFIKKNNCNNFYAEQKLIMNWWDLQHPVTGAGFVDNELWCVNQRGHIFGLRIDDKTKDPVLLVE